MRNLVAEAKAQYKELIEKAVNEAIAAGELPEGEIPKFNIEIPADNKIHSLSLYIIGSNKDKIFFLAKLESLHHSSSACCGSSSFAINKSFIFSISGEKTDNGVFILIFSLYLKGSYTSYPIKSS